jgi:hypothetical protein
MFKQHQWDYLGNVTRVNGQAGLYHCLRCGKVSLGAPTDPAHRERLADGFVRYSSRKDSNGC